MRSLALLARLLSSISILLGTVPFLFIFIIILFLALWRLEKINLYILLGICSLLIFIGNLIGGGYEKAILIPFNDQSQYYYDALTVPGWKDWLASS